MHAGEVKRRTNRKTKTEVVLIDNRQNYHESYDERWLVVCEDHDTWSGFRLRKHANRSLAKPDNWCEPCRQLVEEGEKVDERRTRSVIKPLPTVSPEVALKQYRGDDCPTSSHFCRGCFQTVRQEVGSLEAPANRAHCRTLHNWRVVKGSGLTYQGPEEALVQPDSEPV